MIRQQLPPTLLLLLPEQSIVGEQPQPQRALDAVLLMIALYVNLPARDAVVEIFTRHFRVAVDLLAIRFQTVSYTHLTLPTILLV